MSAYLFAFALEATTHHLVQDVDNIQVINPLENSMLQNT